MSGMVRSPSLEKSAVARTRMVCQPVLPAAKVRVAEVPHVIPSTDNSTTRARLVEVGSTAGATRVMTTVPSGPRVGRTRRVAVAVPPSLTVRLPPTVSTTIAGASLSMISVAMPSIGTPV